MDALSDVLKSVRLEGAIYLNAEFTAPWCIRGECGLPTVRQRLAGADHVAFFHFLTEGACKARLAEGGEVFDAQRVRGGSGAGARCGWWLWCCSWWMKGERTE